ncbi:ornithine decarboxylase [Salinarchaeum sp. Harcht-Bsk1]|uniref:diaminopimelate decarboxylase n=1 Tax=Salinarchaeum sp. Harcht-Bsk1 TaxID=1333523 RepID=UPI00034233A6|nr:diaminopimelate decarboxylase [Salinarchaeum sp. Harcht-Bsk1]AGN01756.1 ornithine decarboxylase [Salinarchaeum sp. Harcht-Bsk1]
MTDSSPPIRRLADWDHDELAGLADEYGTPLYVTDLDRVAANYDRIDDAFEGIECMYAAKANTGQAVMRRLLEEGANIECAAAGELHRAVEAGAEPNTLQYTATNPPAKDLDWVVDFWETDAPELTVTIGATDTLDRLEARGYDGRIAIRVNPGIGAGHHEKVATGKDAKFGIPHGDVPEAAADAAERFDLVGLHAHVGSGMLTEEDLHAHRRALERVADAATVVESEQGSGTLDFVDVGGGFGVPYREDEEPLDLDAVAATITETFADVDARLKVEPGRYVVADASLVLTAVNTIKEAPEATVVGVDASLATMIRPAMFDSYHPIRNVSAPQRAAIPASVGGPLCTSADVFCTGRPIAEPRRGDLLAIGNTGAYGIELANQFHSQPKPAEVGLEGGEASVLRGREDYDDLLHHERLR